MNVISQKLVTCPKYDEKVLLDGNYRYFDDYKARFMSATCPVIENNNLPKHKQRTEYKLMFCRERCRLLKEFKEIIDIEKDGYSQ